jgi:hypothetical protein
MPRLSFIFVVLATGKLGGCQHGVACGKVGREGESARGGGVTGLAEGDGLGEGGETVFVGIGGDGGSG